MKTLYDVLGVAHDAPTHIIKSAFRRLAWQFHPDIGRQVDSEKYREAEEAYTVLSDPEKREEYDRRSALPMTVDQLLLEHEVGVQVLESVLPHAPAQDRRGNDLVRVGNMKDPQPPDTTMPWLVIPEQGAPGRNRGAAGTLFVFNPMTAAMKSRK